MVAQKVYYLFASILIFGSIVAAVPVQAAPPGQNGICPDNTNPFALPASTYPGDAALCAASGNMPQFVPADPCGQALAFTATELRGAIGQFLMVPPASMAFPGGMADLRFVLAADSGSSTPTDTTIYINSFNSSGVLLGSYLVHRWDYPSILDSQGNQWYLVEEQIPLEQGGFFGVETELYTSPNSIIHMADIAIGNGYLPEACTINNASWSTPTPSPTPSVTPTNPPTPTGTLPPTPTPLPTIPGATSTPWSTAPAATASPQPTSTPQLLTTRYVALPTAIPGVSLAAVALPALELDPLALATVAPAAIPTRMDGSFMTPNATTIAQGDAYSTRTADTYIMVTRWYSVTEGALVSVTMGTGISSTQASADLFVENLTTPIRYVKNVQYILPNLWVFVAFLIVATAWINWLIFSHFIVNNGGKIIEIIRRLIELIPGF